MTYYIEQGGIFNERMDLRFDPSGSVTILAGTHSHGQGHATVYAQMVHEWLGVPFETIRFIQGDTGQVAMGRGTYAARSSLVGGNALKVAADAIIDKAKTVAATLMEAAEGDLEFKDGNFRVAGTDKTIPLTGVARRSTRRWVRSPRNSASASRRRAPTQPTRPIIRTARMCARWRSIPRPAKWRSTATSWSTTSAACSTR